MSEDNDKPEAPGSGREHISPIPEQKDPGSLQHREIVVSDELSVEKQIDLTQKSYSQGELIRRRFFRHKGAMASLAFLVFITLMAVSSIGYGIIPGWWDKDYYSAAFVENGGRPTLSLFPPVWGEYPFGQEDAGKDYFALTMRGTQRSLIIAFTVGIMSTLVGTLIGAIAGYFRGWIEAILMRITDLFIVIPLLVMAAVLGQVSGGGIWPLAIMLSLVTWTGLARLVRGEVLSLRERDFVMAAEAVGTSSRRIIFKHILPNTIGTIIVSATLSIAAVILLESALSFLGFGVKAPDTSLGQLISIYQNSFTVRPWLFWWPGMIILGIALSVNFLGDGLRDAFDPRQSRSD
ncbi:ABC transporter permease [Ornithinimicrobium murale]|uniref:ABC transporter permease n=1 Tax=Ornithinimicrobium murale TaxID=1050153 RepID=UPI000E0DC1DE|nr:ABC transporter permease [Ornithinimicrobium murale]